MEELPLFVELPIFEQYREDYLSDDEYRKLQKILIDKPEAGDKIKGTGGLRKVRYGDKKRGKGTRGGIRVIYYYQVSEKQFLLFTLYNKDEMTDLSEKERKVFKQVLANEIALRRSC
jgi:hypothetical protein